MAQITLNQVSKLYPDGTVAVRDLDLRIGDGEFCILVGPSGCGKTTTLNMIAGLEDVSSGELRIGGDLVNNRPAKDRDIAMVFQSYALYPHMTVRQNMSFGLKLAGLPKATINQKVDEVGLMLGLTEHLDRKPSQLSGGQRQRVAMGRAIVRSPKAFLMDEPLSNLDAKLRVQMRTEIARLQHALSVTTVYVTHDQTEAMTLGDRVAVMSDGILQQYDSPRTLYAQPKNIFVAGFIGSPAMNLFDGTVNDGAIETVLGPIPLSDRIRRALERANAGREVVVGIRPEHISDSAPAPALPESQHFSFGADVEVVESLGSDVLAHFTVAQHQTVASGGDHGNSGIAGFRLLQNELVARLGGASTIEVGQARFWLDTSELHLFDRASGKNLLISPEGALQRPDAARRDPVHRQ